MPRTKSVRKTSELAAAGKKTRKSTSRKSKKKKAKEEILYIEPIASRTRGVTKKRKRSVKGTRGENKRAKLALETERNELNMLKSIGEITEQDIEPRQEKNVKKKVSKQVIGLTEKLTKLKMKMKDVLKKAERKQDEFINLEIEVLRLKELLEQKVKEETKMNKEIMNLRAKTESDSKEYAKEIKAKQFELSKCLEDVKQLQQNLLRCEAEHEKTKNSLKDILEEKKRNVDLKYELTQQLKKAEHANREGQINLKKVQTRWEDSQKRLQQSIKKSGISEKAVKSLEAELKGAREVKILLESEVKKIYSRIFVVLRKMENECEQVRKLRGENDLVGRGRGRVERAHIRTNTKQNISGKSIAESQLNDVTSRLEVAWKEMSKEIDFLRSKLATRESETKEGSQSKNEFKRKEPSAFEKLNAELILQKDELEEKVNKMSSQIQMFELKKKIMGSTIREGTKGRMKLRRMLDDAKRAKIKAETALLKKEGEYTKQTEELKSQLVNLEARFKAKLAETN